MKMKTGIMITLMSGIYLLLMLVIAAGAYPTGQSFTDNYLLGVVVIVIVAILCILSAFLAFKENKLGNLILLFIGPLVLIFGCITSKQAVGIEAIIVVLLVIVSILFASESDVKVLNNKISSILIFNGALIIIIIAIIGLAKYGTIPALIVETFNLESLQGLLIIFGSILLLVLAFFAFTGKRIEIDIILVIVLILLIIHLSYSYLNILTYAEAGILQPQAIIDNSVVMNVLQQIGMLSIITAVVCIKNNQKNE